jgi:DNA-binding transcriptional ArsR family regulator
MLFGRGFPMIRYTIHDCYHFWEDMATQSKLDLMLHPVRLRILLALAGAELTTQQLARRLGDVPASSIYRHINRMIAAGLIDVVAERPVRGTVEKTLRLSSGAQIGLEEAQAMSMDDHRRGVLAFLTQLMHEWETYLSRPDADLVADLAGYRLVSLHASDAEWLDALKQVQAIFQLLAGNGPGPERRRRLLATLTWPAPEQNEQEQP